MYLLALIPAFIVTYYLLVWWFQMFFGIKKTPQYSASHIVTIVGVFFIVIILVAYIPDPEIANRIQHALGGGFLIVLITFLALGVSRVLISRFQFFFISLFLATAFGVANELAESLLQIYFGLTFAPNINDTWYDLWSNSIGAILGVILFTPFLGKKI